MYEGKVNISRFSVVAVYIANVFLYGFTGLYYCFVQLYLYGETTHSDTYIGFLLSFAQTVAIFAPMFWGVCADKARYKKTVLLIIMAGVTVCYCLVPCSDNFWWLLATMGATMFFLSAISGVLDVISMETAATKSLHYGPMRLMGMLGYAFIAFGLSFFISGNLHAVFKVCAVLGLLSCVITGFMPKVKGYAHAKKLNLSPLLKGKELLILIGVLASAQFGNGYYMNYFSSYLTHTLGAPEWLWGTNVLLTTISEAPFFFCFDMLYKRFGMRKLVVCVISVTILRYFLLAVVTQFTGILLVGFVTGAASVSLLYSINYYVNQNTAPSLKTSAQTLINAVGIGVPRMLAVLIGGAMTETFGANITMMVCAAVAFGGLCVYFFFMRSKKCFSG